MADRNRNVMKSAGGADTEAALRRKGSTVAQRKADRIEASYGRYSGSDYDEADFDDMFEDSGIGSSSSKKKKTVEKQSKKEASSRTAAGSRSTASGRTSSAGRSSAAGRSAAAGRGTGRTAARSSAAGSRSAASGRNSLAGRGSAADRSPATGRASGRSSGRAASSNRSQETRRVTARRMQDFDPRYESRDSGSIADDIIIICVLLLCILMVLSYCGLCGTVGKGVNVAVFGLFGRLGYVLPFLIFPLTVFFIANKEKSVSLPKILGSVLFMFMVAGLIQLAAGGYNGALKLTDYFTNSRIDIEQLMPTYGGLFGGLMVYMLCPLVGKVFTAILLVGLAVILFLLITGKAFITYLSRKINRKARAFYENRKIEKREREIYEQERGGYDDDYESSAGRFGQAYDRPRRRMGTIHVSIGPRVTEHRVDPNGNYPTENPSASVQPGKIAGAKAAAESKDTKKKHFWDRKPAEPAEPAQGQKSAAKPAEKRPEEKPAAQVTEELISIESENKDNRPSDNSFVNEELGDKFADKGSIDLIDLRNNPNPVRKATTRQYMNTDEDNNIVRMPVAKSLHAGGGSDAEKGNGIGYKIHGLYEETESSDKGQESAGRAQISDLKKAVIAEQNEAAADGISKVTDSIISAYDEDYEPETEANSPASITSISSIKRNKDDEPVRAEELFRDAGADEKLVDEATAARLLSIANAESGEDAQDSASDAAFPEDSESDIKIYDMTDKSDKKDLSYDNISSSDENSGHAAEPTGTGLSSGSPAAGSAPAAQNVTAVRDSSGAVRFTDMNAKPAEKPAVPVPEYVFPPVSLLRKSGGEMRNAGSKRQELEETIEKLQRTFESFGVSVTVTDASVGPTVTRYELLPDQGVKVKTITSLSDDIKLALAATEIRIEAPIPGKAAVGIEVPNKESSPVLFGDMIDSEGFRNSKSKLSFAVGKDIAGESIVANIGGMPHALIAGATGSGKSVCINALIMSILYKAKPSEVKMVMIDPKRVELVGYNGIPHLLVPVVTDVKKANGVLSWSLAEMDNRYQLFADNAVTNLASYNELVEKRYKEEGGTGECPDKLPQILIIIDELNDLMMTANSKEIENAICRLTQLARACGIHVILATQRPSVNVITGTIKANIPTRIAFAVSSIVDSRTILDQAGAEKLLGKGDMLFYPQGYPKPVRVQGAYVSDGEVAQVVKFIKEQYREHKYDELICRHIDSSAEPKNANNQPAADDAAAGQGNGRDEYFYEAGKFIIEKQKASIGMLQRVYKIGFNRAARIMDQLSEAGVVGPEEGTKPRKILMNLQEFDDFIDSPEN